MSISHSLNVLSTPSTKTRLASELSPGDSPQRKTVILGEGADLTATAAGPCQPPPADRAAGMQPLLDSISILSTEAKNFKADSNKQKSNAIITQLLSTVILLSGQLADQLRTIEDLQSQVKILLDDKNEQHRQVENHVAQVEQIKSDLEKRRGEEAFRRDLVQSDRTLKIHEFPADLIVTDSNSKDLDSDLTKNKIIGDDDIVKNALHNAKISSLLKKGAPVNNSIPILITSVNNEKRWEVFNALKEKFKTSSHFSGATYSLTKKIRDHIKNGKFKAKNSNTQLPVVTKESQILIRPNRQQTALNVSVRKDASEKWSFLTNASCSIIDSTPKHIAFNMIELTE